MKGKIYRLYNSECCYIGSTIQKYLNERKAQHKVHFKFWIKDKFRWTSSFILYMFDEEVQIELLEEIEYDDKTTLLKLEQYYIEKYRDNCVNERNSITDPREYNKEYRLTHYSNTVCECGSIVLSNNIKRHTKSKKHQDYVQ